MKTYRILILACCVLSLSAFAHSGHTNWGPWNFDWEVKDDAGLALRNVNFRGERMIYKVSMPVIRVKYDNNPPGSCGPYADQLNWDKLVNSTCTGGKYCQRSFISGGHAWLESGVYARIGHYHLYQAYYLSDDGQIDMKLWSKGLQCHVDHNHHPYWRIDFDINGAPLDQIFVHNDAAPNEGWGAGWHKYTNEFNEFRNPVVNRYWFVRDNPTAHGAWVLPRGSDVHDGFSSVDVAGRLYRLAQDKPWPFGAWGEVGYSSGADIQEKDVVLWYVGHLRHRANEGDGQWEWVGPVLKMHKPK